jgi:hypothetical protein
LRKKDNISFVEVKKTITWQKRYKDFDCCAILGVSTIKNLYFPTKDYLDLGANTQHNMHTSIASQEKGACIHPEPFPTNASQEKGACIHLEPFPTKDYLDLGANT